jgi:hypothetical protein
LTNDFSHDRLCEAARRMLEALARDDVECARGGDH